MITQNYNSNLKSRIDMKLALELPGGNIIPPPFGLKSDFKDLASFLSPLINIIFYIAVFLAFYFLIWGAFAYLMAQGKKEELAKARARISWALVGLIVISLAFVIAKYASEIFPPTKGGLPF